jgi:hypothetical protein
MTQSFNHSTRMEIVYRCSLIITPKGTIFVLWWVRIRAIQCVSQEVEHTKVTVSINTTYSGGCSTAQFMDNFGFHMDITVRFWMD